MTAKDRWIERYWRRLELGRFLHRFAELLAMFLFAFGAIVLASKLMVPALWPNVLWLAAAAMPVAAIAWYLTTQQRFSRAESVALLDRKLGAGGLLMTLSEASDERWEEHLPRVEQLWRESLPKVRPVRFAKHLSLPLLFAVGACFVPLREASPNPILRNSVGQEAADELEQTLELLEEADALPEEEKEKLREEIEKLAEETKQTPLTHEKWETFDAIREQLNAKLETASLSVENGLDAVSMLGSADAQPLTAEQAAQLEKNLGEALEHLLKTGALGKGTPTQNEMLKKMMASGQCKLASNAADRKQQLDALKDMLARESKRLSECRGQCQACQGGNCKGGLGDAKSGGKNPGRGGVTRGRGDAELTWGDESDLQNTKFKETVLPPGYLDEAKDEVVGLNPTAPEIAPTGPAPRNTARLIDPAAGRETWNRTLQPRHRGIVRKYFDSSTAE